MPDFVTHNTYAIVIDIPIYLESTGIYTF